VELAQEINAGMPTYVARRVQDLLNDSAQALRGSSVLILGVTYKPNIADQRESPAVPVAEKLLSGGARVDFHDPHVPVWRLSNGDELNRVEDLDAALAAADIVVLLQAHVGYDLADIATKATLLLDTGGKMAQAPNVEHL
jgi:UDP-N-acetyl-D-mannosaminuronate dehydrogenase